MISYFKIWADFSNIRSLFGTPWFEQKQKEDNRTHPILITLEQKTAFRHQIS